MEAGVPVGSHLPLGLTSTKQQGLGMGGWAGFLAEVRGGSCRACRALRKGVYEPYMFERTG